MSLPAGPLTACVVSDRALVGGALVAELSRAGFEAALSGSDATADHCPDADVVVATYDRRDRFAPRLLTVVERPCVVVVDAICPDEVLGLLRAGAVAVIDVDDAPATLVTAVWLAAEGYGVVDSRLLSDIARSADDRSGLTERQLRWLRSLNDGITVEQLAGAESYSVRAMYRLLAAMYQRLGVSDRPQAINELRDRGFL